MDDIRSAKASRVSRQGQHSDFKCSRRAMAIGGEQEAERWPSGLHRAFIHVRSALAYSV